jgi:hypothetical protein
LTTDLPLKQSLSRLSFAEIFERLYANILSRVLVCLRFSLFENWKWIYSAVNERIGKVPVTWRSRTPNELRTVELVFKAIFVVVV